MKTCFKLAIGWLFLLFLIMGPVAGAEQIIVISDADTTLDIQSEVIASEKIENVYPGMVLDFAPIILKNDAHSDVSVTLKEQNTVLETLIMTNSVGDVLPETVEVLPLSTYQINFKGIIKNSLGNEAQETTTPVPIVLQLSATRSKQKQDTLLPLTNEALLASKRAALIGLLVLVFALSLRKRTRE